MPNKCLWAQRVVSGIIKKNIRLSESRALQKNTLLKRQVKESTLDKKTIVET